MYVPSALPFSSNWALTSLSRSMICWPVTHWSTISLVFSDTIDKVASFTALPSTSVLFTSVTVSIISTVWFSFSFVTSKVKSFARLNPKGDKSSCNV